MPRLHYTIVYDILICMLIDGDTASQRTAILTLLLIWEGRLNRGRLMELFDLGVTRASVWIREFRELHEDWLVWDSKTRSFHATSTAYHVWHVDGSRRVANSESLASYLSLVGLPNASVAGIDAKTSTLETLVDLSAPAPRTFAALSEAIRMGRAVRISYKSMRHPELHDRTISPHTLVRAGRRWHVRAYCDSNHDFRDYTLGRIAGVTLLPTSSASCKQNDTAWATMISIRLVAHPDLTPEQQSVVRFEYFANASARVETCRGALVAYFIQDVRAATDTNKQRPPDYQLAVGNIKEVKPWLFPS